MWKITLPQLLFVLVISISESSKYTEKHCVTACQYHEKNRQCDLCAIDPPVGYTMCLVACRDRRYDEVLWENLDKICDKCFENKRIAKTICRNNCGDSDEDKRKRICWLCHYYEVQFGGGWM